MKIYTFLAQDQEMMYKNYFLSSLPENFEPHPTIHKEFYVDYGFNSAFELRMHQKVSFMLEVCRKNFGNIILFSDADLQFFGPFKKTLIQELGNLDMVCMEDVKSITKIVRTRDYVRWKGIDENNLNQLRKEKEGIDEEHFLSLFHNEV